MLMELTIDIVGWALLYAMLAVAAWHWIMPDRAEREMRKRTSAADTQPRYTIVETIEPGLRVVQDRYTGKRVIVTDRGGAAEI